MSFRSGGLPNEPIGISAVMVNLAVVFNGSTLVFQTSGTGSSPVSQSFR